MTFGALFFVDEFRQLFFDGHRISFMIAALQIRDDTFEGMFFNDGAATFVHISKGNFFFA